MLISRKKLTDLENELRETKIQLSVEQEKNRRSAFIESAALPKCKSLACADCKHVVGVSTAYGGYYILGCGKNNPCPEYEKTSNQKPLEVMTRAMVEALQSWRSEA